MPMADIYPSSLLGGFDLRGLTDLTTLGTSLPAEGCWGPARVRPQHPDAATAPRRPQEEDRPEISEERCSFWRTEVEVALRFYHRLAHTDPMQVRQFFDDSSREPAAASGGLGLREDLGHLRMPF